MVARFLDAICIQSSGRRTNRSVGIRLICTCLLNCIRKNPIRPMSCVSGIQLKRHILAVVVDPPSAAPFELANKFCGDDSITPLGSLVEPDEN